MEYSFNNLKRALTTAPILALPNFLKEFELEDDALGIRIGVVLMQDWLPIAFFN